MQKDIIIFQTKDGTTSLEVNLKEDTVWLNQKQMADLFEKNYKTISKHIKNIYKTEELEQKSTIEYFSVVQTEGKRHVRRTIKYYNLDMIISVGYRVNSKREGTMR